MKIKYLFFLLTLFLLNGGLLAQNGKPKSSDYYLQILGYAKDSLYEKIVSDYDDYISQNPQGVNIAIEKCKLVGQAFYDSYDDYNPYQEEFDACVQSLVNKYPENHQVLFYWLENAWGDSSIAIGQQMLEMNRKNPGSWSDKELSQIHEELAQQYSYYGTPQQAIESAVLAQTLNDSIDLSQLLARKYIDKQLFTRAKEVLLNKLDSTDGAGTLRMKANLLMELGLHEEALRLFEYAQKDTTAYFDYGKIAKALISNGKFEEARAFLKKDLNGSYNKSQSLHNLFEYDYRHSHKDSLLSTYGELLDEDFHNDTFGKYRLMMMFRAPFEGWRWEDAFKPFAFILLFGVFLIAPYLWVLPIDFISRRFGIKNTMPALQESSWGLTDFWLVASGVFIIEVLGWMIFYYPNLLSTFFNDSYIEESDAITLDYANSSLFYFGLVAIMILGFLKKSDFSFLKPNQWSLVKCVGLGILFSILLRSIYFALSRNGIFPAYEAMAFGSIIGAFKSINQFYHPSLTFLLAVIIVPFYEEYIFRGIMLNGMDRRIKFIAANIIQAIFFSLVHDNASLFLFYFLFGLISGLLVRRSNSLLPALTFHATNNLLAFISIMKL